MNSKRIKAETVIAEHLQDIGTLPLKVQDAIRELTSLPPVTQDEEYFEYRDYWKEILDDDLAIIGTKDREYGGSWKKRGGIGAFMMLCRKWDRLEEQTKNATTTLEDEDIPPYDIIQQAVHDDRPEGLLDDIADLRRYLLNVEAEVRAIRGRNGQ